MNITPIRSKIIMPGTFVCRERPSQYGRRKFDILGPVERYSDIDLLNYCNYVPEFGGMVERGEGYALVHVYIDTD